MGRKADIRTNGPISDGEVPIPGFEIFWRKSEAPCGSEKFRMPGTGTQHLEPDSLLASAFYYPTTFSKLRLIREAEPNIRFAEFGNADAEIPLPYVRFDEYASMLGNFSANVVRGENSAIKAMLAGKPFLWDFYKESNGAHEDKIGDFLDFVRPHFVDPRGFGNYSEAVRAFNAETFEPNAARKCADVLAGDPEPFARMAETVRKHDLTMTVVAELEA